MTVGVEIAGSVGIGFVRLGEDDLDIVGDSAPVPHGVEGASRSLS